MPDLSHLTDAALLNGVIDRAVETGHSDWQEAGEKRLRELAATRTLDTAPATEKQLDRPISDLFQVDRHQDLDRILKTVVRTLGIDYGEALTQLGAAADELGTLYKSAPDKTRAILSKIGIKELDLFEDDVRLSGERDDAIVRELDASLAEVDRERLDGDGRVLLDADTDVAHLLNDPEAKERRWRQARDLDPRYRDRGTWESDELLALDSGVDLVATLTRPARIAAAHQKAAGKAKELDAILESDRTTTARTRELDQAIGKLEAARNGRRSDLKQLDDGDAVTFVSLPGAKMLEAIDCWERRGKRISLDAAAAIVSGRELNDAPTVPIENGATGEDALALQIADYQQANDVPYTDALAAVTGIRLR
ncbi:MAG TPA: hypothetical protein VN817_10615 [Solirubrobacteraceae bacterium]|nr:hypothetical protein [Solirubrobacteraceae bacterium]